MVDAGRLRDTCLELVSIPSPTGDTSAVTERFGELLTDIGMTVELVRDFPGTPTLVGRLAGRQWAPAGALALALTLPQLYTSRDAFSEPTVQVLLFGGLSLLVDALTIGPGQLRRLPLGGHSGSRRTASH